MATGSIAAGEKEKQTEAVVMKPFKFVCKPKVASVKVFATTVPLPRSIAHDLRNTWIADLGLYRGRSFKLSFGPQNSLVLPNTFNNLRNLKECELFLKFELK